MSNAILEWLVPAAIALGSIFATAIGALVRWSVLQDRRINACALKEPTNAAIVDLGKIVQAAQSKDSCRDCRREVDSELQEWAMRESLAAAFEQIRDLRDEAAGDRLATAKLEGKLDAVLSSTARLEAMVTALAARREEG